jgi:hypothetical protein
MRITSCLAVAFASVFLSGCSLVGYPSRTTLPPAYFRSVSVRDADSHELISSASVYYEAYTAVNWAKLEEPLHGSVLAAEHRTNAAPIVLLAVQRAPGRFEFVGVQRWEWSRVYFPLCLPLGGVLHHYYTGSVVIEAPGHDSIRVSGAPPVYPSPGLVEFDGGLTVLLPPRSIRQ